MEYFSIFSPNTGKYGPEKNYVFGHFSRSDRLKRREKGCRRLSLLISISGHKELLHLNLGLI